MPTSAGSWKKQESSRKRSISALLTMSKSLTVWITINCGKFWKRWKYQTTCLAMLWVKFWLCCIWLAKPRPAKKKKKKKGWLAFLASIVEGRPCILLGLKWWGIPQVQKDSQREQPNKLQMFPTGRKHLVFCTDLSHRVILSDFEKYYKLVYWLPFPSVVKNIHLGNFFKNKK